MLRYLCLSWDAADAQRAAAATALIARFERSTHAWHRALCGRGLHLYATTEGHGTASVHRLFGNQGVVLGTLFEVDASGSTVHRRPSLDAAASERLTRTNGKALVRNYWGNYVAVLRDATATDDRFLLIRGPASSIPCLNVACNGVQVYCSSIEDCAALGLPGFSINWPEVASRFLSLLPSAQTGLREVSQVLPGECVDAVVGSKAARLLWDPYEIARTAPIEGRDEAEHTLRRAVKTCVHSWAACHDTIMLSLSGGLDSSIVLACLRDAPTSPRIVCMTEYSPGADSDERQYARLVVARSGCDSHIESLRSTDVDLRDMLHGMRTADPQSYFRRVETTRAHARIAAENGAGAIYSGSGGDQLFCQSGARLTVTDFVKRKGLRVGLGRVAYDAAQLEGDLFWRVLGRSIRDGLASRRVDECEAGLDEVRKNRPMLQVDRLRELITGVSRATLGSRAPADTAPGTYEHVCGLAILDDYYDTMAQPDDPEQIAPLFSQPLMEATLRIPTYLLMLRGWDRGLARRAFRNELPEEIARRRSKGGIGEITWQILRQNLNFTREILLDGQLVQHGLLRKEMLAEAFSSRPSGATKGVAEICGYLDMEVWLQRWMNAQTEHAAA